MKQSKSHPRIIIGKCVWGETYTETMLSVNIPSLLSRNNIGGLREYNIEHHLYTTTRDRETIASSPIYQYLTTQIQCQILTPGIATQRGLPPYEATIERMNAYHQRIIDDCAAINASWLFDQPDHVWSDGSLLHLVQLGYDGWDVVFFPGVRTNITEMVTSIGSWRDDQTGAIEISPRSLVGLALKHMHFHDVTRFWGLRISTPWPHHIAWRVAPGCFLRRCFYPQPFLINTRNGPRLQRSIDFSYINTALERRDRVHFINDSDNFFVAEVSDKYRFLDYSMNKMSMELLGNWAIRYATEAHREAFSRSIVYHTEDVPKKRLERIEIVAEAVSNAVNTMAALERVAGLLMPERPRAATFVRLCLSQSELIRRVRIFSPLRLRLPSEEEIPDFSVFDRALSVSALDAMIDWIGLHVLSTDTDTHISCSADAEVFSI